MLSHLPSEWGALLALVFVLGLRHGIDADHIATIDALTRLRSSSGRRSTRWCGALFALGHGSAVMLIVGGVALASRGWQAPSWLAPLGAWVSISMLAALGLANLRAAVNAAPGEVVRLCGFRGRMLERLQGAGHPAAAAGVGALFAVSFDTVSLAILFALSGSAAGGAGHALVLGAAFGAGMLLTDGANGWWLARLLQASGQAAVRASRFTATVVALVSLTVAALGVARFAWPAADAWVEGTGPWLGAALLVLVLGSSSALLWRARERGRGRSACEHALAA